MAGAGARGMLGVAFGITPDHEDFPALREEFFRNYEQRMTRDTFAFDGVAELLSRLRELGFAWGVVTNKSMRFTGPLTQAMPLFATAGAIVGGDSTPHSKPHPAPLFEAARQLGLPPERCLYVGDDERDVAAGRAAGMPTVAATYGYLGGTPDVDRWNPDARISSPLALLPLLQSRPAA
jgi:phosphoglycolate phosphatase